MRWFVWILIASALVARGEVPATSPTTQPVVEFSVDSPVRTWFSELASADETKRDEARTLLMGLTRDDLPRLRELVARSRPLAAEQAAALHEIVVHVYLSGEPYAANGSKGFLGLQHLDSGAFRLGTPVQSPLPGFPSCQMLRDGDLIRAVVVHPEAPSLEQDLPTPNGETLHNVIAGAGANQTVVLEILRQGQTIRVPLRLLPRPVVCDESQMDMAAFITERQQKGEEYWQREFVPLVRAGMS